MSKDIQFRMWIGSHLSLKAVSYLVDDELPDDQAEPLRAHLAGCPRCRGALTSFLAISQIVHPKG